MQLMRQAQDITISQSCLRRSDVENVLDEIIKHLQGIKCYHSNDVATSCADAIAQALQAFKCNQNLADTQISIQQQSPTCLNTKVIEEIVLEIKDDTLPFVD